MATFESVYNACSYLRATPPDRKRFREFEITFFLFMYTRTVTHTHTTTVNVTQMAWSILRQYAKTFRNIEISCMRIRVNVRLQSTQFIYFKNLLEHFSFRN